MSTRDEKSSSASQKKQTKIIDLPAKDATDKEAGEVKGGVTIPLATPRWENPNTPKIDPCWGGPQRPI